MSQNSTHFSDWLVNVLQDLGDAASLEEALHIFVVRMKLLIPHQTLAIVILDQNTDVLRIKTARELGYSFIKQFQRTVSGELILRVFLKHETIVVSDMQSSDPAYQTVKLENDFASACLTPIIQKQRVVGYIHCDRKLEQKFTPEEANYLRNIGYLIGMIMGKYELINQTHQLIRIDEASKALKYGAFLEELKREITRAKTYNMPLSIILINIDNYPKYVAIHGIPAGHKLLEETYYLILDCVHGMDIVGRFSADQFIICTVGSSRSETANILEKTRKSAETHFSPPNYKTPVTITGIGTSFENKEELDAHLPLGKILTTLGSGLITMRSQGMNRVMMLKPHPS